jgi:hypothetical protein
VDNIKTGLEETGRMLWIGLIWHRRGTYGWLSQRVNCRFDKMWRVFRLSDVLLASEE